MRILNILYLTILIGLLSFSFSCNGTGSNDNNDLNIKADAYAALEPDIKTVILDVRTDREFSQGHLEKAILMDIYKPDFKDQAAVFDKDLTYYVYCSTGVRSLHAVKYLRSIGILKSFNIEGGINRLAREGVKIVD